MNNVVYRLGMWSGRFIFLCTMRTHLVRSEIAERPGGYILALTHLGHLDPFCSCVIVRRKIRWMARKEFFRYRLTAWILPMMGAFSVNRQGIPVSSIRRAIHHAKQGEIVGICPEGGRALGPKAAIRGGAIKQGVCSVAIRSGVPVVPCVMLGTENLNRVAPWLPFKRASLWVIYGEPLPPPVGKSNRAKRLAFRSQLSDAYVKLYAELRTHYDLPEAGLLDAPSRNFSKTHDWFYRITVLLGRFPLWATSRQCVVDPHHADRRGAFIIAANHFSHYDFLPLMRTVPRRVDVVSTLGAFSIPFVGWFFGHMNALPLNRHHHDPKTVRDILDRLAAGRVIAMFPEGNLRDETNSVVGGGRFKPGVTRIAQLAKVPIIPAVVYGTQQYRKWYNWLPLRRVRYGVIYGEPIDAADEKSAEEQLRQAFQTLYKRLRAAMDAQP